MSRTGALSLVLLAIAAVRADDVTNLRPPVTPQRGLEQIGSSDLSVGDHNFADGETHRPLWAGVTGNCPEALDALLAAGDDVEPKLLAIAQGAHGLDPAHLRAALVLVIRGNAAVLPTVYDMLRERDSHVRYCGVMILFSAVDVPAVRSALDTTFLLECYRKETEEEVRGRLAQFFGEIRLQAAVELLAADLEDPDRESNEVEWALRKINDPPVVPAAGGAVQDPRERLLRIGEDEARAERDRTEALQSLGSYDCSELLPRILAILQSEPEEQREQFGEVGLSDACVRALAASRDAKVTRALVELGLDERLNDKRFDLYGYDLHDALNERLGTHYFTWKFLQWHMRHVVAGK